MKRKVEILVNRKEEKGIKVLVTIKLTYIEQDDNYWILGLQDEPTEPDEDYWETEYISHKCINHKRFDLTYGEKSRAMNKVYKENIENQILKK